MINNMLYKFRGNIGIENKDFIRDIKMIRDNEIWCSSIPKLNDPTEASFSLEEFEKQLTRALKGLSILRIRKFRQENVDNYKGSILKLMDLYLKNCGVYSLTKTFANELMWAYYGNSHQGYCIEYDFSNLKEFGLKFLEHNSMEHLYRFSKITYSNKIYFIRKVNVKYDDMIKFLFYKSEIWKYEEEYRIVTNLSGKYLYNEECLKSITFGLNMHPTEKDFVIETLKDKGILFYEMKRKENEFKFYREEL